MNKYKIDITFLPHPKTKKLSPLVDMQLITKLVTKKRADEIAEKHADSVWPWWEYTLEVLE